MKTNKIVLSTLLLGGVAVGVSAFAYNSQVQASLSGNKSNVKFARNFSGGSFTGFNGGMHKAGGMGGMFGFIDQNSLTQEQKDELKKINEDNKTKMDALMQEMKSATTDEQKTAVKTKKDTLWKEYMQSIRKLVPSDKLTAFDAMVAKGPQEMKGGMRGSIKGKFGTGEKSNMGLFGLNQFIDFNSLTQQQKDSINAIMSGNKQQMSDIMGKLKTATTDEEKTSLKSQLDALRKSQLEQLRPYVKADKLTEFDAFVANGSKAFENKKGGVKGFNRGVKHSKSSGTGSNSKIEGTNI